MTKTIFKLFTIILKEQGDSLDMYTDRDIALSKFRPNYYDLAVLDHLMPHLNGLILIQKN